MSVKTRSKSEAFTKRGSAYLIPKRKSLYDDAIKMTMQRQAKEADIPFFNDDNNESEDDSSDSSENKWNLSARDKDNGSDDENQIKEKEELDEDGGGRLKAQSSSSSNSSNIQMDDDGEPQGGDLDAPNTYMDYPMMTTQKNTEIRRKQTMNRRATIFAGDVDSLTDQFIEKKHTKTKNDLKR